jgi:hypothetical protein
MLNRGYGRWRFTQSALLDGIAVVRLTEDDAEGEGRPPDVVFPQAVSTINKTAIAPRANGRSAPEPDSCRMPATCLTR